ncbi:MAG: hypothetical protein ACKOC5_13710 [Chloroflexota bacterium]
MTLFNDSLSARLKAAVEQIRPQWTAARLGISTLGRRQAARPPAGEFAAGGSPAGGDPAESEPYPWPPTLNELMSPIELLPEQSLTLGACDDGLPFLLDLANPAPGALLICGEAGSAASALLRTLAGSLVRQNSPQDVTLSIVTADPDAYLDLQRHEHCQEIFAAGDPAVELLIEELDAQVEGRRRGRAGGETLLLLIDGLEQLELAPEALQQLCRLVRHGPRYRVWTAAGLDSAALAQVDASLLAAFRTRLLGRMDAAAAEALSGSPQLDLSGLEDGLFLAPYGEDWLGLWACAPENPARQSADPLAAEPLPQSTAHAAAEPAEPAELYTPVAPARPDRNGYKPAPPATPAAPAALDDEYQTVLDTPAGIAGETGADIEPTPGSDESALSDDVSTLGDDPGAAPADSAEQRGPTPLPRFMSLYFERKNNRLRLAAADGGDAPYTTGRESPDSPPTPTATNPGQPAGSNPSRPSTAPPAAGTEKPAAVPGKPAAFTPRAARPDFRRTRPGKPWAPQQPAAPKPGAPKPGAPKPGAPRPAEMPPEPPLEIEYEALVNEDEFDLDGLPSGGQTADDPDLMDSFNVEDDA